MENVEKAWRLSVQLTPEQAKKLIELRKQDEYCRRVPLHQQKMKEAWQGF